MDFRSFTNNFKDDEKKTTGASEGNINTDNVKRIVEQYQDLPEDEIIAEIRRVAKSGNISVAKLQSYARTIKPFLSEAQRKKLDVILSEL
ncbi:MAG: hypothetical protein FWB72_07170 [Firmicutes bacterium]|nr:hypothetical protein [Bacillota bacterium]